MVFRRDVISVRQKPEKPRANRWPGIGPGGGGGLGLKGGGGGGGGGGGFVLEKGECKTDGSLRDHSLYTY